MNRRLVLAVSLTGLATCPLGEYDGLLKQGASMTSKGENTWPAQFPPPLAARLQQLLDNPDG